MTDLQERGELVLPGTRAWPPPTLPINKTNETAQLDDHPNAHNETNAAINELVARIQRSGELLSHQTIDVKIGAAFGGAEVYTDQVINFTYADAVAYPFKTINHLSISGIWCTTWTAGQTYPVSLYTDQFASPIGGGMTLDYGLATAPSSATAPYFSTYPAMNGIWASPINDDAIGVLRNTIHANSGAVHFSACHTGFLRRYRA